jgi:N-acetylglucosamine-6-phosphate deacetylase
VKMCSLYPAKVMQKKGITGTIEINENADLLCLSADRQLLKMYLA